MWGNVWQTPCVARIDPADARVKGWILLEGLAGRTRPYNAQQKVPQDVLNGIAYDSARKRLFVTGKKWARMFEVLVVEVAEAQQEAELERARDLCRPRSHPLLF